MTQDMRVTPLDYARPLKGDSSPDLYITGAFLRRAGINVAVGLACLGFVYWTGGFFQLIAGLLVGGVTIVQGFAALWAGIRMVERSSGPLLWRLLAAAGMLSGVFISAFASWSGITRADWCC